MRGDRRVVTSVAPTGGVRNNSLMSISGDAYVYV